MERYALSACWILLSGIYIVELTPVREKISINTDLLNKVRDPSNNTIGGGPDRHHKVHNFAWRISVTVTTPPSSTILSVDELAKHPEHNTIIHNTLINTLKDQHYRTLWQNLVNENYYKLIYELKQPGAQKVFIKDNDDGALEENLYTKLVNFLEAIGIKGYKIILDTADGLDPDALPEETEPMTEETTTVRRTTISAKEIEQDPEFFTRVYIQLSCTLKTKALRDKWNDIINAQGYMSLLEEMRKPGAHKIFMRDNGDNAWKGPAGVKLYEATVNLLHTIGRRGYETLLDTVNEIPLSPGEKLGLTPPS